MPTSATSPAAADLLAVRDAPTWTSSIATLAQFKVDKNLNSRYIITINPAYVSGTALSFAAYVCEAHKVFESKGDVQQNPPWPSPMKCLGMDDEVHLRPIPWPTFCSSGSVVHFT
jgi:hypothetical protein